MTRRWAGRLRRPAWAGAVLAGLLLMVGAWARHEAARPDRQMARARQALAEERYERAEDVAAMLERAGEGDRARLIRAESLRRLAQGQRDSPRGRQLLGQALEQLDGIRDTGPLRWQAAVQVGLCLVDLRQLGEAARTFSYVLEQDPEQVDAHRGLAAVYYDLGALKKAARHLEEVARLDPTDGRPHRLLGLIHKDLEEHEAAVASYRAALAGRLAPAAAQEVRLELAEVLVRQAQFGDAQQALGELDEEQANGARARAVRVEALWGLGEAGRAEGEFQAALTAYPRSAPVLLGGAKVLAGTGRVEEAAGVLERAVAVTPNDYASRYQLAAAYESLGRAEAADGQRREAERLARVLDELTRLNREADARPWDAGPRRRMAELCLELGRTDEAAMWRQAAEACALPAQGQEPSGAGPALSGGRL